MKNQRIAVLRSCGMGESASILILQRVVDLRRLGKTSCLYHEVNGDVFVPDSQIIHRDLKPQAASRVAWAVIFVCACGAWGSVPAHASMIYSGESMAVDPFLTSINGTCSAAEPSFEWYSFESRRGDEVAGSMPKSSPVSVPISPPSRSEQLPVETPFLGVEVSSSTGASGAGTVGSSSVGGASSFSAAIFCGHTELSPPTLVGWLRACDDRDIPPAPPFELLRPPKILTIFA